MSLWGLAGGESINFLRVFRAFRVMRLFKKLQPMRKILISLGACIKPVLCAFVILFILASVYAQAAKAHAGLLKAMQGSGRQQRVTVALVQPLAQITAQVGC